MKKIIVMFMLLAAMGASLPVSAQRVTINISSQPLWGPVGYDYVEYYYIPSCGVYYYVPSAQFIYLSGNDWVFASGLPGFYSCDLYSVYKVVINKPKPYLNHRYYVVKYPAERYYGSRQVVIKESNSPKYNVVPGHANNTGGNGNVKVKKPPVDANKKAPVHKQPVKKQVEKKHKKEIHEMNRLP